jgi:hypothetical protein
MLRVPLVAEVARKLVLAFGLAMLVQPSLAFEDQIGVKDIRESSTNAHARDVPFEQNWVRLLQAREGRTQKAEEGIADGVFRSPALAQIAQLHEVAT